MSEKDKALLQRKGQICLGATCESKIPIHNGSVCVCLTSPLTTLTASYRRLFQNPSCCSRMHKMRAKERASEGRIYISTADSAFRERETDRDHIWLLKNVWCLYDKRWQLRVDLNAQEWGHCTSRSPVSTSEADMGIRIQMRKVSFSFNWAQKSHFKWWGYSWESGN